MNDAPVHSLTFSDVDGVGFAAERGRLNGNSLFPNYQAHDLAPVIELLHLTSDGLVPRLDGRPFLTENNMSEFYRALTSDRQEWVCPDRRNMGFIKADAQPGPDNSLWTAFGLAAQKAAVVVGFDRLVAAQLVGAMEELYSNIFEHSGASATGTVSFQATNRTFEFVASDRGIGVLRSLRTNPEYAELADHGHALRLAISDGCSRFGSQSGRGLGFRPLFIGLANLNGSLRFRSGDHALTIDGSQPSAMMAKAAQKPMATGFLVSARCALL